MVQAAIAALAIPQFSEAASAPGTADYLRLVHPDLRAQAAKILDSSRDRRLPAPSDLPQLRAAMDQAISRPPLPSVPWHRTEIKGNESHAIAVYVANSEAGRLRPAILYLHGGGFIMGSARAKLREVQELAKALDCVVVAPEYRLAPETSYVGSIEDNYASLRWLHTNARALGIDPARIAVMGESAGGGHAALLAILARDRGEVPLAFQCLIYPMLDDRTGTSRPASPNVGVINWTADWNRLGWSSFLGVPAGSEQVPQKAVPARITELAKLPPAFVGVGSLDLFFHEDVEYARRLNDAGVMAELVVVPGAFHGFDLNSTARLAQDFNAMKLDALRRGLGFVDKGYPELD